MPEDGLTFDQANAMRWQARELRSAGNPSAARQILDALERGEYMEWEAPGEPDPLPDSPPHHGPGSGIRAWQEFARAVSDIDEEILTSLKRRDLIQMLVAQGHVTKPAADAEDDE